MPLVGCFYCCLINKLPNLLQTKLTRLLQNALRPKYLFGDTIFYKSKQQNDNFETLYKKTILGLKLC